MIKSEFHDGNYLISHGSKSFFVHHNIDLGVVTDKYNKDEFFCCFFFCANNKSAAFKKIDFELSTGRLPIAWLIPSNYYFEPYEFYEKDGVKFLPDFAYAAYENFFSCENNEKLFNSNFEENVDNSCVNFSDFVNSNLYFLVVSKSQFKKTKLSLLDLEFLLSLHGLHRVEDEYDIEYFQKFSSEVNKNHLNALLLDECIDNIHLGKAHDVIYDNLEVLHYIYKKSIRNIYDVSSYMTIYQILELIMEHMLERKLLELNGEKLKAWDLKEKLSEISSEGKRLNWIAAAVETNGGKSAVFEDLRNCINELMVKLDFSKEIENKNWITHLYKLRNVIVHNQLAIYRKKIDKDFFIVNAKIIRSISEIIKCYS